MTSVLNEIERQKRIQQAHTWDANEKALAERLMDKMITEVVQREKVPTALVELQAGPDPTDEATWRDFVAFANREGVRHLPAKPQTVGAYILFDGGMTHEQALDVLRVIARRHDEHELSSPCAAARVRAALELLDDKPPQTKPEKPNEKGVVIEMTKRNKGDKGAGVFNKPVKLNQGPGDNPEARPQDWSKEIYDDNNSAGYRGGSQNRDRKGT
jgi:hypothetical protein